MTTTTSPPSASEQGDAAPAFARLHPKVQQWIWRQGWQELRAAQAEAVEPIIEGQTDVVISAATAAGKTEAAFLPIISRLLSAPATEPGVDVVYISPLKALINDQHGRLEEVAADLDITVSRWHGDVAGNRKTKLFNDPSGIVLITPESIEALLVLHGANVGALVANLRYVVVDELHAFIGSARGAQLQSLLHRLELIVRRRVPRIGLSATLSNLTLAADFLRPGGSDAARLIKGDDGGQELRFQLRGYMMRPPRLDKLAIEEAEAKGDDVRPDDVADGDQVAIASHLFQVLHGSDNLVFCNSRRDVEVFADLLATHAGDAGVASEFVPHHGSLSRGLREHVEARLKGDGHPITAVCTSTLEMGIDIGQVASVAQVGAPPSVAALRQRLGRSGRRDQAAVLRLYVAEPELTDRSPLPDWLRPRLGQTVAMAQLLLRGWIEDPWLGDLHLSTLIQQLLSLIAQHGGVRPSEGYDALCRHGPFQLVTVAHFAELLRELGRRGVLMQSDDGLLLLGIDGERLVNHHSFYPAFTIDQEWRLVAKGRQLGTMPIGHPIMPGSLLIFAGRRWKVRVVDDAQRVIELQRSQAGRPPRFSGSGGQVHRMVRTEMQAIYRTNEVPSFLDARARDLLEEGRDNFRRLGLDESMVVDGGDCVVVFPWTSDRISGTLVALFTRQGLDVAHDGVAITVSKTTVAGFQAEAEALLAAGPPDPEHLAAAVGNKATEKYDSLLPSALLDTAYAARSLDLDGAYDVLRRLAANQLGAADP